MANLEQWRLMVWEYDYGESERNDAAEALVRANKFADVGILIVVGGEPLGNAGELCVDKITLKTYRGETAILQLTTPGDIPG